MDSKSEKILVSDDLDKEGLNFLRGRADVTFDPQIKPDEIAKIIPDFQALIVRSRTKVTKAIILQGESLKVIGRAGVGVDNIDLASAQERGIKVVNSPFAPTTAVAELTIGLMIALARNIPRADGSLKSDKWEKNAFKGSELGGKTLGLVGIGRIGSETARLACAMSMRVIASHPRLAPSEIQRRHAQPATFEQVLKEADYLSLHLPLTDETRHLIGGSELALMKKGARIICTARGGIVDEEALKEALDNGQIAGAALDVFATEPPGPDSIATHPRVIATPHIGALTSEAQEKASIQVAEEVINALQGKPLRWQVTGK